MFCGLFIAAILHSQPVCTETQFRSVMGDSLRGEHELIATAIFDDYADQLQAISFEVKDERSTPLQRTLHLKEKTLEALQLFDDLLSSLQVVAQSSPWNTSLAHLRRTVLLKTQHLHTSWESVVWADLPETHHKNTTLVQGIDRFLQTHAKEDRINRLDAKIALLQGDVATCKSIEKRVMQRWVSYQQLVQEVKGIEFEQQMYPHLDQGLPIHNIVSWINEHVGDGVVADEAISQFNAWHLVHTQQKNAYKKLVADTRSQMGVDPVSSGCTTSSITLSRVTNRLLQLTAEMLELNKQVESNLYQLLTPEQLESMSVTGKKFTDNRPPVVE